MLTVVPECLPAYKKIIDDGFAQSFGEAMKTERKVSNEWSKNVNASAIEERREGIRQRGQQQKS